MKPRVKYWIGQGTFFAVIFLLALAWLFYFHNDWVLARTPGWLHGTIQKLGQHVEPAVEEDEDPDNTKNEIPVHVGKVTVGTVHRYIEGFGIVVPRPPRAEKPGGPIEAGSANIAAPVAGIVAKVNCQIGQKVHAGETLIQLDDRLAKAAEEQAQAAVAESEASLALLRVPPKPDQVQIAQLAIEKAQAGLDFARRNLDRQKQLAADQAASSKAVEQAALDVSSGENDLAQARKQLALLTAGPVPDELHAAEAKVRQAAAALSAARQQREMLAIPAPLDATVVAILVNPGESVDTTRTLVQLIAMDRLMVNVDVPADQLPAKAQGLATQLMPGTGPFDPSTAIDGNVAFVSPQVESKNGSVMVGIDLPADAATALRPGLTVRVRIIAEEHKDVPVVPREAVVLNENKDQVISIVEGDQAKHHTVKIGLEENGLIEIAPDDQVKEGVTVVTQGAFGLRETQQTRIKVVE